MTIKNVSPSTLGGIFGLVLIAGTTFVKGLQSIANGGNNNNNRSRYDMNTNATAGYYYPRAYSNGQGGSYVPYTAFANNNFYAAPTTNQYPYTGYNNETVSYYGNYNNSGPTWGYDPMSRRNMTTEQYQDALMKTYGTIPSPTPTTSYGYAYGDTTPTNYISWRDADATTPVYTPPTTQYASIVAPQYSNQQMQTTNAFTQTPQYTPSHTIDPEGKIAVPGYDPTSRRNLYQNNTVAPTPMPTPTAPTGFAQPVYQNPTPTTNTFDWNNEISSKISTDNSATNFWSNHLVPIGQSQNPQYQNQSMFQYQQQQPVTHYNSIVNPYGMNGQYNYGYGYGEDAYNNQTPANFGYNYNTQNQFQTTTNYNGYGYGYDDPVQYSYGNNQAYTGYQNPNNQLYNNQFAGVNNQGIPFGWPGQNARIKQQVPDYTTEWFMSRNSISNFNNDEFSKKSYHDESYGKIPVPRVIIRQPVMQQPIQQPTRQMAFPQVHEPPRQVPQEQHQQYQNPNVVPTSEQINNNKQQYQRPATNEQPQQLSACDRFFCDIPTTVIPEQNKVTASGQQETKSEGCPSLANLKIPENGWFKFGNNNNNPITAPVVNPLMMMTGKETSESEQYQEEERPYPTLAEVRAKLGAEQAARVTIETDENGKMISYHFNNVEDNKSNENKKENSDKSSIEESADSVEGATPAFILN